MRRQQHDCIAETSNLLRPLQHPQPEDTSGGVPRRGLKADRHIAFFLWPNPTTIHESRYVALHAWLRVVLVAAGLQVVAAGCGRLPTPDPESLAPRFVAHGTPPRLEDGRYLVGWIEITQTNRLTVVQTIPVHFNTPSAETLAHGVRREDMNFDGFEDIGALEHGGAKWGRMHWWFYDPHTGSFRWTTLSDDLHELTFADYSVDISSRRLEIKKFRGAELHSFTYEVREGRLQLAERPTGESASS